MLPLLPLLASVFSSVDGAGIGIGKERCGIYSALARSHESLKANSSCHAMMTSSKAAQESAHAVTEG